MMDNNINNNNANNPNYASTNGPTTTSMSSASSNSGGGGGGGGTTNIHTIVRAQIVFLLSTLTEENFDRNLGEIRSLSDQHGIDTYTHFIRRVILASQSRLLPNALPPTPTNNNDDASALAFRLLVQEMQRMGRDPVVADRFREAIDRGEGDVFRTFDLRRLAERTGMKALEKVILASAFVTSPSVGNTPFSAIQQQQQQSQQGMETTGVATFAARKPEFVAQAVSMIRGELENAVHALSQLNCFESSDIDLEKLARLLVNLMCDPKPAEAVPVLEPTMRYKLLKAVQDKYGKEAASKVMLRVLPTLSLPTGTSLVQVLNQLGPDLTDDAQVVRALLSRFGITDERPPRDAQVLEIMGVIARLASEGASLCDVGSLVRALSSFNVALDWPSTIRYFDSPTRSVVDTTTLKLLIAILHNSPRDTPHPHAVTGFWAPPWSNSSLHLRLLDSLLSLPSDTFSFVQLPGKRIVTVDNVSIASPTIKSLAANVQGHTWNSLELFEVLVSAASRGGDDVRGMVREMLDKAVKISAELVHIGLLMASTSLQSQAENPAEFDEGNTEIRDDYARKLLAMFLAGHPNHQLVFMRLWQIAPSYLTDAFRGFYDENPLNITRILDVAQDLKILEALLDVRPFTFALDVASLASRREYLNLDKWLADNVAAHGEEFLHSVIVFLDQKMDGEKVSRISDPPVENRTMPLNPGTITIFLRVLRNSSVPLSPDNSQYALDVRNACLQIHPRLMSLAPNTDVEPGFTVISYAPEIEHEVDGIYKQMYDENITIDEVVSMMTTYKDSTSTRDHEIFSCMVHFLFDEYKFFQSYYPPRELAVTGYLFGSLIQFKLIEYIPLGIAVRYIVDALNCPPETNLFKFGVQALARFEARLGEWQALCQSLMQIPHLGEVHPDLAMSIQRALAGAGVDGSAGLGGELENGLMMGLVPPIPVVFTAIQPEELGPEEQEGMEPPPEDITDKMLFIVNNLDPNNFASKVGAMREAFKDEHAHWFANYLIEQRVSTEPNNHALYLRLLDSMGSKQLMRFILHETITKSARLLNSESTMTSGSDRLVLKHIATWLGLITLARDKPLKHKYVSLKDLLLEGHDSGRLAVAVPFVCKTLEPASQSRVFRPPNPWLMAVLGLLAELYHWADMKLNLKFEIEVLCKSLDVDLAQLETSGILRSRPSLAGEGMALGMPEYVGDMDSLPIAPYGTGDQVAGNVGVPFDTAQAVGDRALGDHIEGILDALVGGVVVSAQIAPYNVNPAVKRAVQVAVERAVREIILPVVERSVTISGISMRELVAKDFATEAHEDKMRKAGQLMAQRLAGGLALVTCKEPLRTNLPQHLRRMFAEGGFHELMHDDVINILMQANLDLACQAVEKAAMERAVADVDENLDHGIQIRRRYREMRTNQPFWDPAVSQASLAMNLPDPLKLKANGLNAIQAAVYEDFGNDGKRRYASATGSRPGSAIPRPDQLAAAFGGSPAPGHMSVLLDHAEIVERFSAVLRDIEAMIALLPDVKTASSLPPRHDLRSLADMVLQTAEQSAEKPRTPMFLSQKIVQAMYKTTSQLGREVYCALLERLCTNFSDVLKEVVTWLLYAEDERKYNVQVTATILRSGLVDVGRQDQQLAQFLVKDPKPSLQTFVAGLIRECLTSDPPVATQRHFNASIEVMVQLVQSSKSNEDVINLIADLRGVRRPAPAAETTPARQPSTRPENEHLREKLFGWFQQWISIFQRAHNPEKSFVPFITQLTKQGILKVEDLSSFFFRVCAESSVTSYIKLVQVGETEYAFQALDAMSRLIAYIIKYHGDASGVNNDQAKVHYFTKILSIFVLVLASYHEDETLTFEQKPFFRFFSSLVNDLSAIEVQLGPAYFQLLLALSDTFSSLQPTYFPGFSFSWLCLISHRQFLPKLLASDNREGWSPFHKLLLSLFKFLSPFLKDASLQRPVRDLYRGTLRLLLVLLHDFPDFLSEYYFTLCDAIPQRCIQLRNIILSAFPPTLVLPDPYLRTVSLDQIQEIGPIPPILSDFAAGLKNGEVRGYLDQFLLNRGSAAFLPSLIERAQQGAVDEENYNLAFLNSLVMYVGVSTVVQAKARGGTFFVATDPGVVVLQFMMENMEPEGQHHMLSAIMLHLRHPNAHTHWFGCLLMHLFLEINDNRFREIVTRVLLERFLVHRPHPWGAIVTFIELLRNPKYDFWSKDFVHVSPQVNMLLQRVARCIQT